MLKSLAELSPNQAEEALSVAGVLLLPRPEEKTLEPSGIAAEIVGEVKQRLGIRASDVSPESVSRIQDVLSRELLSLSLSATGAKNAKARLGQRGTLRPDLYRITFARMFHDVAEKLGVRPSHIEESLRRPDAVEHLAPKGTGKYSSLYVKRINPPKGDSFLWLIETEREGDMQQVHLAWRAYDSDVATVGTERPRDLLSRFLDVFGMEFRIGDSAITRLVFYESFPDPPGFVMRSAENFPGKPRFVVSSMIMKTPGAVEVSLAYAVNVERYTAALARHGVFTNF